MRLQRAIGVCLLIFLATSQVNAADPVGLPANWRSLELQPFGEALQAYERPRDSAEWLEAVDHAWTTFLSQDTVVGQASMADVMRVATAVLPQLSAERRTGLGTKLTTRLDGDSTEVTGLSYADWYDVSSVVAQCGVAADKRASWDAAWIGHEDRWQDLEADQLQVVLKKANRGPADSALASLSAPIGVHAWQAHVSDPAKLAALHPIVAVELADTVQPHLSDAQQDTLAGNLKSVFDQRADRLSQLPYEQAIALRELSKRCKVATEDYDAWLGLWLTTNNRYASLEPSQLDATFDVIEWSGAASSLHGLETTLRQHVWQTYLSTPAKAAQLSTRDLIVLASYTDEHLSDEQLTAFTQTLLVRLEADPQAIVNIGFDKMHFLNLGRLSTIPASKRAAWAAIWMQGDDERWRTHGLYVMVDLLRMLSLDAANPEIPPLIAQIRQEVPGAIAERVRKGKGVPQYSLGEWVNYFGAQSIYDQLRVELVLESGLPDLAVGCVLSHAAARTTARSEWQTYLDEQIAEATSNDARALWLVVKSYDAAIQSDRTVDERRRRRLLDEAYAAAEIDEVRLQILGDLAQHFRAINRRDDAVSLIASVETQFDAQTQPAVAALRTELEAEQVAVEAAWTKRVQERTEARRQVLLDHYTASLARANADGNTAAAARIQAAITELQNQAP